MSAKRPGAVRPALGRRRSLSPRDATDPAGGQRDDERAAVWLYAWSHAALRPTGELLAARVTSRAIVRPGRESPGSRLAAAAGRETPQPDASCHASHQPSSRPSPSPAETVDRPLAAAGVADDASAV